MQRDGIEDLIDAVVELAAIEELSGSLPRA